MSSATEFIWKTFQQTSNADRKDVPKVSLYIDSMDGVAYTANNEIHFSANYIQQYIGNVKTEFIGVIIMANMMYFLSFLAILSTLQAIHAVEYSVVNNVPTTPGGFRFTNEIGLEYSKQTLISATEFTWRLFQQNSEADRRTTPKLSLFIETLRVGQVPSFSSNNEIRVNANYIQGYSGDVRKEITGIIYHEVVHSWQWNGKGQAPVGLIEGIADFVRMKAGYTGNWRQPGWGNRWDEGNDITAWFLDYCNGLRNGFVAEINKKMKTGYSDDFFFELLGKTVDQISSGVSTRPSITPRRPSSPIHRHQQCSNHPRRSEVHESNWDCIQQAYSKQTMSSATDFIWKTFQQTSNADRKNVPKVSLSIDSIDGVAYTANNVIHVMERKRANTQRIEGIADFVRLKTGYPPGHRVKPGKGDRWDQGYDVTAHFLDYCEGLRSGFVAELNKKMRTGYSGNYFVELLGKTVDQLWSDYKAKYSGNYFVELLGKTVGQLWSDKKAKYNTN
ncbi:hypothetical protein C3L33_20955, partial [Rhododendron williamsianum]